MGTFLKLEFIGVLREYKKSIRFTLIQTIITLCIIMFMTIFFHLLSSLYPNQHVIYNIILLLTLLFSLAMNKDLYIQNYLGTNKDDILNLYPYSYKLLVLLKGVKYEVLTIIEISFVLFVLFLSMALGGYSLSLTCLYYIITVFLFVSMKNLFLVFKSIYVSKQMVLRYFSLFIRSIITGGFLIILYYALEWMNNVDYENAISMGASFRTNVDYLLALFNINLGAPLILFSAFIGMILSYILKVAAAVITRKGLYVKQSKREKLFLIRFIKHPILQKEYYLLKRQGIIQSIAERVVIYLLAAIILIIYEIYFEINITLQVSLILLVIISEVIKKTKHYAHSSIGYEHRYIINYILSDYRISTILRFKSMLLTILLCVSSSLLFFLLSIIFQISILDAFTYFLILISFIFFYSTALNYFYTYRTSVFNQFMIPNKYAPFKLILLTSLVLYVDLTVLFIGNIAIESALIYLFPLLVSGIHLLLANLFQKRMLKKEKYFYGEFRNAVSEK